MDDKQSQLFIWVMAMVILLRQFSIAYAESKIFVKAYTYQASEQDSKISCRTKALDQVKRLLLEELGSYLESHTEVKNFQITRDDIFTVTSGMLKLK